MRKIYLSGKISNPDPQIVRENLNRLNQKAEVLRSMGEDVFNPAELETDGWAWEKYLARDLLWITENQPMLYMTIGWQESLGARLEHEMALLLGLKITYEGEGGSILGGAKD